jgi:two-component system sensor kinase FixL
MMGELVASLTHELNQPLGAVLSNLGGLARLLAQGNPDSAMAARAVNNAIEDAKRAGEIVRRVRAMFRGDVTKKTSIGMAELVNEVATLVASEASLRQINVQIQASPALPAILGDRILLQQCLLNLLMNAFEALANVDREQRKVTVQISLTRPEWIEIRIKDTGPGIHPSIAARLFEPFVTTKSNGMGLGLLVTRSIIEEHGGKIVPEPSAEQGTTFTLTLPVASRAPKKSPGRHSRKKPAKERIDAR